MGGWSPVLQSIKQYSRVFLSSRKVVVGHFEIPREGLNWPDHRPLPLYVMRSCTDEPTICVLGFRQFANGSENLTLKPQLDVKKILDFTTFKFAAKGKGIAYWRFIWVAN